jgi:DNA-binding response OmpR family regulator
MFNFWPWTQQGEMVYYYTTLFLRRVEMLASPKILIVEDDPGIVEILTEILEIQGLHCDTARDGAEATHKLALYHFDLLITDFRMPKMNGIELLQWCDEHNIKPPVIFLTADFLPPHETMILGKFLSKHVAKPFCIQGLINSVMDYLPQKIGPGYLARV